MYETNNVEGEYRFAIMFREETKDCESKEDIIKKLDTYIKIFEKILLIQHPLKQEAAQPVSLTV